MDNEQRIQEAYAEAVSGIQEQWFIDKEAWYNYVAALPKQLQVTYAIVVLHRQVMNGGFDQYFSNGYGLLFAEFAAAGFTSIGANRKAALVRTAIKLLKHAANQMNLEWSRTTLSTADIISLVNAQEMTNELELLDGDYYKDESDLTTLLGDYLQKH